LNNLIRRIKMVKKLDKKRKLRNLKTGLAIFEKKLRSLIPSEYLRQRLSLVDAGENQIETMQQLIGNIKKIRSEIKSLESKKEG
jgi:hypothetical protein